jgi:hypothetical protein
MANSIATGVAYQDPQLNLVAFTQYTVATVPSASPAGQVIWVSNGAAGAPCLALSNGSVWKQVNSPATTISAT